MIEKTDNPIQGLPSNSDTGNGDFASEKASASKMVLLRARVHPCRNRSICLAALASEGAVWDDRGLVPQPV